MMNVTMEIVPRNLGPTVTLTTAMCRQQLCNSVQTAEYSRNKKITQLLFVL